VPLKRHELEISAILKQYDKLKNTQHYAGEADDWYKVVRHRTPAVDEPAPVKKFKRRNEWTDSEDEDGRVALERLFKGANFTNYRAKKRHTVVSKERPVD
jgi:hypothetical protein